MDAIESATQKIVRAAGHRAAMEQLAIAYIESDPVTIHYRSSADRARRNWLVDVLASAKPAPGELALIAGDCLNNLRSALDHMVWGLSVKHSGPNIIEPHRVQFPILEERKRNGFRPAALRSVSDEARDLIERHQRFDLPGDAAEGHALWLLRCMSNADKHRLLHVHSMISPLSFTKLTPEPPSVRWIHYNRPITDHTLMVRAVLPGGVGPAQVDVTHTGDFVLGVQVDGVSRPIEVPTIFERLEAAVYAVLHDLAPLL